MAQFLLADGPSETWIVGNKLVTITTSGNRSKSSNSGLCSRCLTSLQQPQVISRKSAVNSFVLRCSVCIIGIKVAQKLVPWTKMSSYFRMKSKK